MSRNRWGGYYSEFDTTELTLNVGDELTAMSTQTEEVVNPDGRDFALRIIYPEAGKFEEILITRISMKYSGEWVAQLEGVRLVNGIVRTDGDKAGF